MKKIIPANAILIPDNAKKVFSGVIFDVYQWPQKMFDGSTQTFEMLRRPDTVEIIAIKDDKMIVLEEEQPHKPAYYSFPTGRHDVPGQSVLDGAKRELLEETGLSFKSWRLIDVIQPFAKIEWFVYRYVAFDFDEQVEQTAESDGEKIIVMEQTLDQVKALLNNPKNRYIPKELIESLSSLEELLALPEFKGKEVDR